MAITFKMTINELPVLSINTTNKKTAIKLLEDYTEKIRQLPENSCIVIGAVKAVTVKNQ